MGGHRTNHIIQHIKKIGENTLSHRDFSCKQKSYTVTKEISLYGEILTLPKTSFEQW